jgi:hypothetical protein
MTDTNVEKPGPLLRVVRGELSDVELAALVAIVAARSAASDSGPEAPRSGWTDRTALVGRTPYAGPGAWTASARTPGARTRADW